ncbi:hypothetical protein SynPROS71_01287 [Synechococcus sp. PROS-7-1]|uniref:hypothetical protein n=1 Tax=Synechococcus sp. PROS-7-1 TaxID=1442556 RepID=UPI0016453790|nr:hypothetical protein [Synechococcus sp. PROS-7-1]QNI85090.1 hypothetical protein SynPROS71_01287 [Synechococcus sp. PROS-7-1]
MKTQAQLCHHNDQRCIVRVEAFDGDTSLGSALGEAPTATEAEDQAIARLLQRLGTPKATTASNKELVRRNGQEGDRTAQKATPVSEPQTPPAIKTPEQDTQTSAVNEAPTDPDDWSEELTAIDLELQRIGWDRANESIYLERAFGHSSRHRLTRFSDLVAYLKRLRELPASSDAQTATIPLRRSDLVNQCDEILKRLNWPQQQAREFLQNNFQVGSRQQLSDEQLLGFNMLLEEQLLPPD